MFDLLESQREVLKVQEYSVSQTSLEQIFNQFASLQEEEDSNIIEGTATGSGGNSNLKTKPTCASTAVADTDNMDSNNNSGSSSSFIGPNTNSVVAVTDTIE